MVLNKNIKHEVYSYHFSSIEYPEIIEEFNVYLKNNDALVKELKVKYNIKENFQYELYQAFKLAFRELVRNSLTTQNFLGL